MWLGRQTQSVCSGILLEGPGALRVSGSRPALCWCLTSDALLKVNMSLPNVVQTFLLLLGTNWIEAGESVFLWGFVGLF